MARWPPTAGGAGCLLVLLSVLTQSLPTLAADYTFNFGLNAQAVSAPPVRVGDTLTITYPERYNVVELASLLDWHACNFEPKLPPGFGCKRLRQMWGSWWCCRGRHRCRRIPNMPAGVLPLYPKVLSTPGSNRAVKIRPRVPGYIFLASNMTSADCGQSGVRAIIFVAPPGTPDLTRGFCKPKTAKYKFVISSKTVSADCISKNVATVNGRYPGQTIRVTSGDWIEVTVTNKLNESISLHWHGIKHKGTQWQDGNAFGAQCPIPPGGSYKYRFNTKGQAGTKWWHGHSGFLRASVYGALIIDAPYPDPLPGPIARRDQILLLGDWFYRQNQAIMDGLDQKSGTFTDLGAPDSLPINGATFRDCAAYKAVCGNNCLPCSAATCPKLKTLTLRKGRTYRIRLINSGLYGNINFHIQDHMFTVVEADGELMKPVTYSSIDMLPGMTFSILLSTTRAGGSYWIVTNGRFDNFGSNPGRAILRYGGRAPAVPFGDPPAAPAETTDITWGPNQQASFRNLVPTYPYLSARPTKRTLIRWGIHRTNGFLRYSVNNISFVHAAIPILYADKYNIPGIFDYNSYPDFGPPLGAVLAPSKIGTTALDIPYNSMVDMIFQNHSPPGLQHSWHLHGYEFWVVGMGTGQYDFSKTAEYEATYNLEDAPLRNTIIVYDRQWIAVRFRANNPGLWNLHCHLESHMYLGMQTFIRVSGGPGVPPPPSNYIRQCINKPIYPPPIVAPPPIVEPPPPVATSPPPLPPVTAKSPPPLAKSPPPVSAKSPPPVATSPPPVAKSPPPVAKSPPPVARSPPPVAKSPPPVAKSPPPVAKSPPPVAKSPPPVAKSPPPLAKSPPPVAKSPPPVAVSPPPIAKSPPPIAKSPPPVAVSPPPIAKSPPPVAVSPPPVAKSPPPVAVSPPPVAKSPPPVAVSPPPVAKSPPPVAKSPPPAVPAGKTVEVAWTFPLAGDYPINVGDSIKFDFQDSMHAVMAHYRDPPDAADLAAYTRTVALLQAYVAANDNRGIDFLQGDPAQQIPTFTSIVGPPFAVTLKFSAPGLYLFTCPVHLGLMFAEVRVT